MSNDIKRYVSGEMTSAERHALERKALSDPFLADALEGATLVSSSQFASDVKALKIRISKKSLDTRIIKISIWKWTAGIAAGLLLISVSFFIIWELTNTPQTIKQLALEELTVVPVPKEVVVTDSVVPSIADQTEVQREPVSKPNSRLRSSSATPSPIESPSIPSAKIETPAHERIEEIKSQPTSAELEVAGGVTVDDEISRVATAEKNEAAGSKLLKKDYADDKQKAAKSSEAPSFQDRTINVIQGKVTSAEDGSGLAGINVQIKGTTTGTVTDAQGNYQIQSTGPTYTLEYSSIGLESQEVNTERRSEVNVQMPSASTQLSEVMVTGYALQDQSPKPTVDLAHPQIGNRNYKKYLSTNMRYPQLAREQKTGGNVVVEFFVEADGSLSDFFIVRSVGLGCDEELIRLIKEGPKWVATKKDSLPVRDRVQVQMKFVMPKN